MLIINKLNSCSTVVVLKFSTVPPLCQKLYSTPRPPPMLEAAKHHIAFPFDHVISVQVAGHFKPHKTTYRKAVDILGLAPSEILFVANHAFDCIGAKSCGIPTAFIDRRRRPFGHTPHQPDIIVKDFKELADVLI